LDYVLKMVSWSCSFPFAFDFLFSFTPLSQRLACLDIVRVKANLIPAGWFHSRLCPSRRADLPFAVIVQQSSPLFCPSSSRSGMRSARKIVAPTETIPNSPRRYWGKVKLILFRPRELKWINSTIQMARFLSKKFNKQKNISKSLGNKRKTWGNSWKVKNDKYVQYVRFNLFFLEELNQFFSKQWKKICKNSKIPD